MGQPATIDTAPGTPGAVTPDGLTRARLRIAWDMLAQVGEHADLLPLAARPHVAQALAALVQAKALVEERVRHDERPLGADAAMRAGDGR